MGRSRFLKLLKNFDDNYIGGGKYIEQMVAECKKANQIAKRENQTSKEILLCINLKYSHSQLDTMKIKLLTSKIDEEEKKNNPFKKFYDLENDRITVLFYVLHITDLFLKYFEDYNLTQLRKYKDRQSLLKKYNAVIEDVELNKIFNPNYEKRAIEKLKERVESLNGSIIITERKIFENLLHGIWSLFPSDTDNLTKKVVNMTNDIIKHCYSKDNIRFSRNKEVKKFKKHYYGFESKYTLELMHSTSV